MGRNKILSPLEIASLRNTTASGEVKPQRKRVYLNDIRESVLTSSEENGGFKNIEYCIKYVTLQLELNDYEIYS